MKHLSLFLLLTVSLQLLGQDYAYRPNESQPYGTLNPNAPSQVADYAELIGRSQCKSVARIDQNTWADTVAMIWEFKYIMNGMAVQDETFKADGVHSGSIRIYDADSSRWFVHYYTTGANPKQLPAWEGNREGNEIILYNEQAAPNGNPGYYKIRFSSISEDSFEWKGAWVNKAETFEYPTWMIYCNKEE